MPAVHAPLTPRVLFGARFRAPGRPRQKYPKMQNIFLPAGAPPSHKIMQKTCILLMALLPHLEILQLKMDCHSAPNGKMQPPCGPIGNQMSPRRVCTGRPIFDHYRQNQGNPFCTLKFAESPEWVLPVRFDLDGALKHFLFFFHSRRCGNWASSVAAGKVFGTSSHCLAALVEDRPCQGGHHRADGDHC